MKILDQQKPRLLVHGRAVQGTSSRPFPEGWPDGRYALIAQAATGMVLCLLRITTRRRRRVAAKRKSFSLFVRVRGWRKGRRAGQTIHPRLIVTQEIQSRPSTETGPREHSSRLPAAGGRIGRFPSGALSVAAEAGMIDSIDAKDVEHTLEVVEEDCVRGAFKD